MNQNNILIAKFMGFTVKEWGQAYHIYNPSGLGVIEASGWTEEEAWRKFMQNCSYNYDWNSLMSVVNKLAVEQNLIIKFYWCNKSAAYIAYIDRTDEIIIRGFIDEKSQFKCVYNMIVECIKFVNKHEAK